MYSPIQFYSVLLGVFFPVFFPSKITIQRPEALEPDEAANRETEITIQQMDISGIFKPEPVEADEAASREPEALEPEAAATEKHLQKDQDKKNPFVGYEPQREGLKNERF